MAIIARVFDTGISTYAASVGVGALGAAAALALPNPPRSWLVIDP